MNIRRINLAGLAITLLTLIAAAIWAFPLYWAVVTTLKPEFEVVEQGFRLLPKVYTLAGYVFVIFNTKIGLWYVNSMVTSIAVTVLVVSMGSACGYAISQLRFPGRNVLWLLILASFMVPIQTLIVSHFVLMNDFGLINNLAGVVLPQLIAPVTVIVYKQFFDSISKEYREAAVIDGAREYQIFFHVFLRMNWGVTTALAIITFIGAWNNFLWPFLAVTQQERMNVTVGITQVDDAFGLAYARNLSGAVLAALPVALAYLIFQRRVTQAIMLSAGIKG
jgi:multiple sugar transport system permease protein